IVCRSQHEVSCVGPGTVNAQRTQHRADFTGEGTVTCVDQRSRSTRSGMTSAAAAQNSVAGEVSGDGGRFVIQHIYERAVGAAFEIEGKISRVSRAVGQAGAAVVSIIFDLSNAHRVAGIDGEFTPVRVARNSDGPSEAGAALVEGDAVT